MPQKGRCWGYSAPWPLHQSGPWLEPAAICRKVGGQALLVPPQGGPSPWTAHVEVLGSLHSVTGKAISSP